MHHYVSFDTKFLVMACYYIKCNLEMNLEKELVEIQN